MRPISPLEARINVNGADDACCKCDLHQERVKGATETFIAGTQYWVCADCAFEVDVELARFAYDNYRTARKYTCDTDDIDLFLGLCPECGQSDGRAYIGRELWIYCTRHGLKWTATDIFDDWRDHWRMGWLNSVLLDRFRECEPARPETVPECGAVAPEPNHSEEITPGLGASSSASSDDWRSHAFI